MTKRILIMGLPGSGKTTLARLLVDVLEDNQNSVSWYNADVVRSTFKDWNFTKEGRLEQASRMRTLADSSSTKYAVCDFVAPYQEMRDIFEPNFTIWVDTIETSRFTDTDSIFEPPTDADVRVTGFNNVRWILEIMKKL